jgi:hypothetical protein
VNSTSRKSPSLALCLVIGPVIIVFARNVLCDSGFEFSPYVGKYLILYYVLQFRHIPGHERNTSSRRHDIGKVKFHGGALQHYSRIGLLYSDPKGVPSFISRGAAHQAARKTSASEGRNYRWNLANNLRRKAC